MTIRTTQGDFQIKPIKNTQKVVIGGLWFNGHIDITFWTSENSGVIATYNARKNGALVGFKRIQHTVYLGNRQFVWQKLPLYPNPLE